MRKSSREVPGPTGLRPPGASTILKLGGLPQLLEVLGGAGGVRLHAVGVSPSIYIALPLPSRYGS